MERKPTILICLQNAYAKGSLIRGWHPSRWWQEFLTSRSGKRLQLILPEDVKVHYCNVAPGIGASAATILEPSYSHVKKALNRTQPDYVIACGKLAEPVLTQIWKGNLLCIPHPASRVLTNQLLLKTKELLTCLIAYDFYDLLNENCYPYQEYLPYVIRLALRQRRGSVEIEELHRINPEDEDVGRYGECRDLDRSSRDFRRNPSPDETIRHLEREFLQEPENRELFEQINHLKLRYDQPQLLATPEIIKLATQNAESAELEKIASKYLADLLEYTLSEAGIEEFRVYVNMETPLDPNTLLTFEYGQYDLDRDERAARAPIIINIPPDERVFEATSNAILAMAETPSIHSGKFKPDDQILSFGGFSRWDLWENRFGWKIDDYFESELILIFFYPGDRHRI